MRELVFKNITSENKRRKDLFISETTEYNGIKTITQRHSIYIIDSCTSFNTLDEVTEWKQHLETHNNKRHIFIVKKHDTKLKKDIFICDVVGKFYAVVNQDIYSIVFKHSFQVEFLYNAIL